MGKKKINNNTFEIAFYEKLIKNRPSFVEAISALGDLYTKEGMYKKGLDIDLKLVELKPTDPIVLYNLACSYSLLDCIDLSFDALKKAIDCGYTDLAYIGKDQDLVNLRQDARFKDFFTSIKK